MTNGKADHGGAAERRGARAKAATASERGANYDILDIEILRLLRDEPRAGVREYARRLNVARGTVQSRIDRLAEAGVIQNYAPHMEPSGLGFPLSADIHLTMGQLQLDEAVAKLAAIPFIVSADSLAGAEDLSCRVVARDLEHLERITIDIMKVPGVERVRTEIILRNRIPRRIGPLLDHLRRGEVG